MFSECAYFEKKAEMEKQEDLTFVKVLTILGMFAIGLLPALLPMLVPLCCQSRKDAANSKSYRRHHAMQLSNRGKKFVSALACFGAGVFIATFFLDMIGEVRDAFDKWYTCVERKAPKYPWPEFCAILGFLMVLLMEQVVMYFHSRRHVHVSHDSTRSRAVGAVHEKDKLVEPRHTANGIGEDAVVTIVGRSKVPLIMPLGDPDVTKITAVLPLTQIESVVSSNGSDAAQQQVLLDSDGHKNHADLKSVMRAIILLLALCFHSIFEGIAIGLTTTQKDAWTLFAGVCMHKGIEAFCLGLNISQSGIRPFLVVVFDVLFAMMSPLGIAIGIAITDSPETPTRFAVTAVLQGIASGTFLYCTFIEILPKELLKDEMAHDHDHSNVFLEDIAQHHATDDLGTEEKPINEHTHSSHTSSEQTDKLIKCLVFTVGIAVMAGAVALGDYFG